MNVKRKVFAYITYQNRLLIFSHPDHPDAGLQVPAGTVEPGENLDDAVLREATEETGLTDLRLVRYLGDRWRDMSDFGRNELHQRYFYHLECTQPPPTTWRHGEMTPSDGGPGPIVFEFFWVALPDKVPELIADHGQMLYELVEAMKNH
jgi:8-oxo-dGTP pyrophosphatase MutT (NUDIX family)